MKLKKYKIAIVAIAVISQLHGDAPKLVIRDQESLPTSCDLRWRSTPGHHYELWGRNNLEDTENWSLMHSLSASLFEKTESWTFNNLDEETQYYFKLVEIENPVPEGMIAVGSGVNEGIDPSFGNYRVTISTLYIDTTEVSKAKWDAIYDWAIENGYEFNNPGSGKNESHPVHTVNWWDCVKWCNARSEMEGLTPAYTLGGEVYRTGTGYPSTYSYATGYRLPTAEEWEYAARGELTGKRFPWGDSISHEEANYQGYSVYYIYDNSIGHHPTYDDGVEPYTSPVASFPPNGLGLYDMAGNVWEWCNDGSGGSSRSIRGSSWNYYAPQARCGQDGLSERHYTSNELGFRTVRRQ